MGSQLSEKTRVLISGLDKYEIFTANQQKIICQVSLGPLPPRLTVPGTESEFITGREPVRHVTCTGGKWLTWNNLQWTICWFHNISVLQPAECVAISPLTCRDDSVTVDNTTELVGGQSKLICILSSELRFRWIILKISTQTSSCLYVFYSQFNVSGVNLIKLGNFTCLDHKQNRRGVSKFPFPRNQCLQYCQNGVWCC